MKPWNLTLQWRICLLGTLLCDHCHGGVMGGQHETKLFRLHHEGLLQYSKSAASTRGIGKSLLSYDDFELSVDGQFQMLASSRLFRQQGNGRKELYRTEPGCVSIVALGKVCLKFPETGETFSGGTAVFRVSQGIWILDGVHLKRGGGENARE